MAYDRQNRKKESTMLLLAALAVICVLASMVLSVVHPDWQPVLVAVLLSYSFVVTLRFFMFAGGALIFWWRKREVNRRYRASHFVPPVSVIVPAYNEGKVIASVLKSFETVIYPDLEIIVIDDGSVDATFEIAEEARLQLDSLDIKVFTKPNEGKAKALNFGIQKCRGQFVLCMDSDSFLTPYTVFHGIRHFQDRPKLAAVAGVVRAENVRRNLLTKFQQLDYFIGHFQRKFLSLFCKVSIVPGPIGIFRKKALKSVGWYEDDNGTFAEDTELTFRLIASGWEVICDDGMEAWTEVPENYEDLVRQRYRWNRGIYQALAKNIDNFTFSQKLSNLVFLIYLGWEQVLIPILDFAFLFSFLALFILGDTLSYYTPMLLYVVSVDILISVLASTLDRKFVGWLPVAVLSRLTYVNVLLVWKILAFYDEWKSVGMNWDKLSRVGLESLPQRGKVS